MNISEQGLELIRHFEGCMLKAYKDTGGIWTIGYGHVVGVKGGDTCTQEQADDWLKEDVHHAETCVGQCVSVELTQGEFDALVSFAFNLGCHALTGSTLLRFINNGRMDDAELEFAKWCHDDGKVLPGLVARREAERKLFIA